MRNIMTINCLNTKIAEGGNLRPTIFTAILNLYERGTRTMTARDVRLECERIDQTAPWGNRLAAICNTMRNASHCGARIVSENRNFNEFTIEFTGNIESIDLSNVKPTPNVPKSDIFAEKQNKKLSKSNNISGNDSFKTISDKLDWDKIKDKDKKKLLIIACSDSKVTGGRDIPIPEKYYFNNPDIYNSLINDRLERVAQYRDLIIGEPNYFNKGRVGRGVVDADYFREKLETPLYLPAIERYTGRNFYKQSLFNLYMQKNKESNLHILIVSGFYGLLEFRDYIIDYHFEIGRKPLWTRNNNTSIREAVNKYLQENDISDEMVFYSLSNDYRKALKPIPEWTDLWITTVGDRSANNAKSARCLEENFLPKL
ncbi:MAG: peroxide stress protein YaaA [Paludibacter sp.]